MTNEQHSDLFHDIRKNGQPDDNGNVTWGGWTIVGYARNGNEFFGQIYCKGKLVTCEAGSHSEPAGI